MHAVHIFGLVLNVICLSLSRIAKAAETGRYFIISSPRHRLLECAFSQRFD